MFARRRRRVEVLRTCPTANQSATWYVLEPKMPAAPGFRERPDLLVNDSSM